MPKKKTAVRVEPRSNAKGSNHKKTVINHYGKRPIGRMGHRVHKTGFGVHKSHTLTTGWEISCHMPDACPSKCVSDAARLPL
jgi:hypothetical protein